MNKLLAGVAVLPLFAGVAAAEEDFAIVSAYDGQVIDVYGMSTAIGATTIQFPWWGGPNQQWAIRESPNQCGYEFVSKNSNLVLDIPGYSNADGMQLWQWTDLRGKNQEWLIISSQGTFKIASVWNRKVVDLAGFSTDPGAPIQQWSDLDGANQHWGIVPLNGASITTDWTSNEYGGYIYVWGSGFPPGAFVDFTYVGVPNTRCKTQSGTPWGVTVRPDGTFNASPGTVRITSSDPNCRWDFPGVTVVAEDPQGNVLALGSLPNAPWCP